MKRKRPRQGGKEDEGGDDEAPKITRATPIALYCDRMTCESAALQAALPSYSLLRFSAEVDPRGVLCMHVAAHHAS